jgi:iron(III) transport system permease protein
VLSDFGAVSILRYSTFTRALYLQYRSAFDRAPAAVLGLLLVALTIVFIVLEARTARDRGGQFGTRGATRPAPTVPLGAGGGRRSCCAASSSSSGWSCR